MKWEDEIVETAATDTGMRRSNNQDSYAVVRTSSRETWATRGHLFMVADGMGAHAVGELASKLACDNVPHSYMKLRQGSAAEALTKAFREVGRLIHNRAKSIKDFEGMGTTCSALILLPTGGLVGHVGDSRVYRVRNRQIEQLTFDHSLVWELVRRNHLTLEEANRTVPRNVITRSLGSEATVEVDIEGPLSVRNGDVFVLCSDGLSGPVKDPEIGAFAENFHPNDASRYLIQLANIRGGNDNITLVMVRIGPWVEPEDAEGTAGGRQNGESPEKKSSLFKNLLSPFHRKPAEPEVEENIYASADCSITPEMLVTLSDLVRDTQFLAVEQAWPLDWPELANQRRLAEEARLAGRMRTALRHLGEAIEMLGKGGRLFRKAQAES